MCLSLYTSPLDSFCTKKSECCHKCKKALKIINGMVYANPSLASALVSELSTNYTCKAVIGAGSQGLVVSNKRASNTVSKFMVVPSDLMTSVAEYYNHPCTINADIEVLLVDPISYDSLLKITMPFVRRFLNDTDHGCSVAKVVELIEDGLDAPNLSKLETSLYNKLRPLYEYSSDFINDCEAFNIGLDGSEPIIVDTFFLCY